MREQVWKLKEAAILCCQSHGVRFLEFLNRGLEDILEAAELNDWSAEQIVVRVLADCCIEDGKFNNFHVALLTVMKYRIDVRGSQLADQAWRDLKTILDAGGAEASIQKWVDSWW